MKKTTKAAKTARAIKPVKPATKPTRGTRAKKGVCVLVQHTDMTVEVIRCKSEKQADDMCANTMREHRALLSEWFASKHQAMVNATIAMNCGWHSHSFPGGWFLAPISNTGFMDLHWAAHWRTASGLIIVLYGPKYPLLGIRLMEKLS